MAATDATADRGAPRLTVKGAATRARIVEAAAGLIFERGVARTGIEDVQRVAAVSASQLYHYFADKQALVHAVVDHQARAVLEGQLPLLDRLDSMEGLRAWRELLVAGQHERHCNGGCVIGSLASELAESDADARQRLAAGFARWQDRIRDGLARMRDRGDLRRDADPDALALALLAAVQGGLLLDQTRRDTAALETVMDAMIAYIATFAPTGSPGDGQPTPSPPQPNNRPRPVRPLLRPSTRLH